MPAKAWARLHQLLFYPYASARAALKLACNQQANMGTPAECLKSERDFYVAMQVDEILVWQKWLQLHQVEYDRFDYSVCIGTGRDPGPGVPDNLRPMAIAMRSLHVDAIGWKGAAPTMFTVKRRAGVENVAHLITCRVVWEALQLSAAAPALVLVCSDLVQFRSTSCRACSIRLELVPTDLNFLAPSA